jgi:recombination protein RecA
MIEVSQRLATPFALSRPLPGGQRWRRALPEGRHWKLTTLAGRLSELSRDEGTASLTAAANLILQAQQQGEPGAWIAVGDSIFFPPDLADSGIDLRALPVVKVKSSVAAARAADHLLRCGAFAVIVLDLAGQAFLHTAVQTRLAALAQKHHAALLCLTRSKRNESSLGSLVSLRGAGALERTAFDRFTWTLDVLKDKRRGPGWNHAEVCRGPDGLC